ncbi:hypothetical protein HKX48_004077 [Thoreauomyces humboldtii]|nr:hypothetical protein HKX48_004077 [Thoreauomyces humboldtii]
MLTPLHDKADSQPVQSGAWTTSQERLNLQKAHGRLAEMQLEAVRDQQQLMQREQLGAQGLQFTAGSIDHQPMHQFGQTGTDFSATQTFAPFYSSQPPRLPSSSHSAFEAASTFPLQSNQDIYHGYPVPQTQWSPSLEDQQNAQSQPWYPQLQQPQPDSHRGWGLPPLSTATTTAFLPLSSSPTADLYQLQENFLDMTMQHDHQPQPSSFWNPSRSLIDHYQDHNRSLVTTGSNIYPDMDVSAPLGGPFDQGLTERMISAEIPAWNSLNDLHFRVDPGIARSQMHVSNSAPQPQNPFEPATRWTAFDASAATSLGSAVLGVQYPGSSSSASSAYSPSPSASEAFGTPDVAGYMASPSINLGKRTAYTPGSTPSCISSLESTNGEDLFPGKDAQGTVKKTPAVRVNKKSSVDHPVQCDRCRKDIATIVTPGSNNTPLNIAVTCTGCADPAACSAAVVIKSGKRKLDVEAATTALLCCQACKKSIGVAVATPRLAQVHKASSMDVVVALAAESASVTEDEPLEYHEGNYDALQTSLDLEAVCAPCWKKYGFCTECGGGGTYRTGKYRPRELFQPGRRTCSLPHVRGGSKAIQYKYEAWEVDSMDPELRALKTKQTTKFFTDVILRASCCSQFMEVTSGMQTWEDFVKRGASIERELDNLFNGPRRPGVSRYLAIAWMPAPGPRSKRAEGSSSSNSAPTDVTYIVAGFQTGRYNRTTKAFETAYASSLNNTPKGPSQKLLAVVWRALPEVPLWTYFLERKMTALNPKFVKNNGIKYRTVAEWRRRGREIEDDMFDRSLLEESVRPHFEVYVAERPEVESQLKGLEISLVDFVS